MIWPFLLEKQYYNLSLYRRMMVTVISSIHFLKRLPFYITHMYCKRNWYVSIVSPLIYFR